MTGNQEHGNELVYTGSPTFVRPPPTRNIVFCDETKEVGRLEWNGGVMTFTGSAEESAKIFFNEVIRRYVECVKP